MDIEKYKEEIMSQMKKIKEDKNLSEKEQNKLVIDLASKLGKFILENKKK